MTTQAHNAADLRQNENELQGLVFTGYGSLRYAEYALLEISRPAAFRRWLRSVIPEVTKGRAKAERTNCAIAFTAAGLQRLELRTSARDDRPPGPGLSGFSREFLEGMTFETRARALGDQGPSADPKHWSWGGPACAPTDAVLMMYAIDKPALDDLGARLLSRPEESGLARIQPLSTSAAVMERGEEHFGFADGIAQPTIEGYGNAKAPRPENSLAPGEFILGFPNEYGAVAPTPLVAAADDPTGILPPGGSRTRDFGRFGSYLVFRQLDQNVGSFWGWAREFSRHLRRQPTGGIHPDLWVASKMVGRWPTGAPLVLSEDGSGVASDVFQYRNEDPAGHKCPVGAHIRRSNPRDSLPGSVEEAQAIAKNHRILRRGRPYGEPVADSIGAAMRANADPPELERILGELRGSEGGDRGLHFICLNADIARQFEFIQQTWLNSTKFAGLYDDPDPIAAGHARPSRSTPPAPPRQQNFVVPGLPLRERCTAMPTFVTPVGGAYFFLPGMRSLEFLADPRPRSEEAS